MHSMNLRDRAAVAKRGVIGSLRGANPSRLIPPAAPAKVLVLLYVTSFPQASQTTGYRSPSMSRRNGFHEVTRLYTSETFRRRYRRRARATERAPRSILHRVHKRFLYVLCDWLTPRQSKGSISPFQRPGPGKAVRLLLNGLCFRGASTMTRH